MKMKKAKCKMKNARQCAWHFSFFILHFAFLRSFAVNEGVTL